VSERGAWRPRLLVDFDGVIHRYSQGWADGTIYDPPVEGAIAALDALDSHGYEVVIFSTRPAEQIRPWLARHWTMIPADLVITDQKLPAVALIDDRAIHFQSWWQALTDLEDRYPIPD
jgi:phosphoglycolate phosphatase-like HAD superfamily hydrolase